MRKKLELHKYLRDDISSNRSFSIGTYAVLGVVGLIMTVLNVYTDKGFLTLCTGVFTVLCGLCVGLTLIGTVLTHVARVLFAAGVLCMFTFFLISGNPDGFSAIWICMLPSLGMFFFNRFRGTAMCAVMFAVLVFLLWTPYGQGLLMYDYSATFRMRFPVLFIAFHALAFLLETLRVGAYNEMREMQEYYRDQSLRDPLTGLLNRQGMYSLLEKDEKYAQTPTLGIAMLDIDYFKEVNDVYGHNIGDEVLKTFSSIVQENLDSIVCRWGGEEFVVIFTQDAVHPAGFDLLRGLFEQHVFSDGERNFHVTVSMGVYTTTDFDLQGIDALIGRADEALYKAKANGRNCVVYESDALADANA